MGATSRVVLGRQGRIVIPAEIRRRLVRRKGDELAALVDAGERLVLTREQVWARRRGAFKKVPAG